jgi:uncharacterized repeat protein (TIGR03803 family)
VATATRAALGIALVAWAPVAGATLSLQTLYEFQSNPKNPRAELVRGSDGNFYGTTTFGGTNGENGTVFQLTPARVLTVLHSFAGPDGALPAAGLTQGVDEFWYGSAQAGGTNGDAGTLFRLDAAGNFDVLHSFGGPDGRFPQATLVRGRDGSFYGTTVYGGTNGDNGTLFRWGSQNGFASLFSFDGTNGSHPTGRLLQAADGNFYGTTSEGGVDYNGAASPGNGTIFRMSPDGQVTRLFSFSGPDGSGPAAGLVEGGDGGLYGTTQFGGTNGDNGTVFKTTAAGELTMLYSFKGGDGNYPVADLTLAGDGTFLGSTSGDRAFGGTNTFGTLFRITPAGLLSTLVAFNGTNGGCPLARLTAGDDGNYYGTAFQGGAGEGGTLFRLVEPPVITGIAPANGTVTVSWTSFTNGNYRLEFQTDLSALDWTALMPDVVASGGRTSMDDPLPDGARRFYRVRLLP